VRRLNRRMRTEPRPVLVVKEEAFSLAAFRDHQVGEDGVRSAYGFAAIVAGICGAYGVPCRDARIATVTKHFTGTAFHGGRAGRKAAILNQCKAVGYLSRDCLDDNQADALAIWDWACAHLARTPPRVLTLWP
jgi:hypothetical protein